MKCKHGKLKSKVGRRVCKKRPARRGRRSRRSRSYRRAAGLGLGTLAATALVFGGTYAYWKATGA